MNLPQMIFFDYDNTLVDSKTHVVTQTTIDALNALVKNGIRIAIASGRSYGLLKLTGACELAPWSGYVLNNGQLILNGEEKELQHRFLPHDSILKVIAIARDKGFNLYFSTPRGDFLLEEPNPYVFEAHNFFNEPIPPVGTFIDQPIDKILVYAHKGYDYGPFKAIEGLDTFPSVSTYADLASKGINKAASIKEFLSLNGLLDEYTAFGDSMNDMEMLLHAKISVAMGNGEPALKAAADYVADEVSNNGIPKMLKELGYIR